MEPYIFVSYTAQDSEKVLEVVDILEGSGLNLWVDRENLQPGENWQHAIVTALENASGVLIFISPASMESDWVKQEVLSATIKDSPIFPILLESAYAANIPFFLQGYQWFDLGAYDSLREGAIRLATELKTWLADKPAQLNINVGEVADHVVAQARGAHPPPGSEDIDETIPPDSVFIVHGHDLDFLNEVEEFMRNLGINPMVLSQMSSHHQTLIQKFFDFGNKARFAVVLVSPDDLGASTRQYNEPKVGEKALQFRARQNVVLELGFFYGLLGFESVFVLFKNDEVFPNFERPSDLDGVMFERVDSEGAWREAIKDRLRQAGFVIA